MDRFLSSYHSFETNSLDWTDSEVRLESSVSIVGDSQFPLSFPVCPDSQDTGVRCVTPDGHSPVNSLESSEIADSLDVEQWDLADGEVKSQCPGSRLGHARTVLCPPPTLDTQEFGVGCISPEDFSCVKGLESMEKSTLKGMECWDLADGEAISQDAVGPLREAETPPCPPTSLDTQEFLFQNRIVFMKSEVNSEGPLPDTLGVRDSDDGQARPGYPLRALVGKNMSLCPPSPIKGQDLEDKHSRQQDVLSVDHLQILGLAPGEVKSQRPVCRFYCDSETQPRVEGSLISQEGAEVASWWEAREKVRGQNAITSGDFELDESSRRSSYLRLRRSESPGTVANCRNSEDIRDTGVSTKDVLVASAAHCEPSSWDVRPATLLSRAQSLVLKTNISASSQDEGHASKPASSLDAPLITVMPGNYEFLNYRRSKRKNQDISLLSDNKTLATMRQPSHKTHPSSLKNNSPACRSPLRPLPVNPMFVGDEQDKALQNEEECHKLMVLTTETEDLENRDPGAVPESFPTGEANPTGKENVGFQGSSKGRGATSSSTSTMRIKTQPKFNSGHPPDPFQSPEQINIHENWSKNTLDKRRPCSVQTLLSSHVECTSYPARTKELVSEDYEQTQGWLCPKASKRLLSKKPRQRFLDGWLK